MTCPTFENLIDFANGRLAEDETQAIETHLAQRCDECTTAIDWHRGFVSTASADRSFDPPSWVIARANSLFADAKANAAKRGVRGVLNRLRAALVFDNLAGNLVDAIPARSATMDSRQLLFNVAPYDVDLLVTSASASGTVAVTGQILASEEVEIGSVGNLTVEFVRDDVVVATAETSEYGEFSVQTLPAGTYDVHIVGEVREIVVPGAPLSL